MTLLPRPSLAAVGCLALFVAVGTLGACRNDETSAAPAPSSAPRPKAPKIFVRGPSHDFGDVDEGAKLTHIFVVENRGSAPLRIKKVQPRIGCTVAKLARQEVAPGESVKVEVTFDTARRQGKQTKRIQILSDDPASPYTLTVSANIVPALAFVPNRVALSIPYGQAHTEQIWLTGKLAEQAKLQISKVEGDLGAGNKPVTVQLAQKQEQGQRRQGLTFKTAARKLGSGHGMVTVSTGIEVRPSLRVKFTWNVSGNLTGIPKLIRFAWTKAPDPRNAAGKEKAVVRPRLVQITSKRAGFKVTSARITKGPFTAEILPERTPLEVLIRVTVDEEVLNRAPQDVSGELLIVSNDPLEPKVNVDLVLAAGNDLTTAAPLLPHQIH